MPDEHTTENIASFKLPDEGEIRFQFANSNEPPVMLFKPNGDIYIKGKLAENDQEVVDGLRAFLRGTGHYK